MKKSQYHFYGENKSTLKSLYIDYRKCEIYAIQHGMPHLQDVVKHLLQELCSDSSKLVDIVSCLSDSSAATVRVFSVQNRIKNKYRNRLSIHVLDQLMTARLLEVQKCMKPMQLSSDVPRKIEEYAKANLV